MKFSMTGQEKYDLLIQVTASPVSSQAYVSHNSQSQTSLQWNFGSLNLKGLWKYHMSEVSEAWDTKVPYFKREKKYNLMRVS